jgi:hypothetical protein
MNDLLGCADPRPRAVDTIRALPTRFKLTFGRRSGAAAPSSRIRRLGSGGRDHSSGRRLRPYARSVRLPGSTGVDQTPSDSENRYRASNQIAFMMAPSITTPAVAYCQSATSNFRARATIIVLRNLPPSRVTLS